MQTNVNVLHECVDKENDVVTYFIKTRKFNILKFNIFISDIDLLRIVNGQDKTEREMQIAQLAKQLAEQLADRVARFALTHLDNEITQKEHTFFDIFEEIVQRIIQRFHVDLYDFDTTETDIELSIHFFQTFKVKLEIILKNHRSYCFYFYDDYVVQDDDSDDKFLFDDIEDLRKAQYERYLYLSEKYRQELSNFYSSLSNLYL